MSTICKICVNAPESEVTAAIEEWFLATGTSFSRSSTEWPMSNERERFVNDYSSPSVLSLKQVFDGVTEIHFNSFGKVKNLASALSDKLSTGVSVNQYQSVATASYWAYHLNGRLVREIEAGDGEVYAQSGASLDFENEEPGRDISEEGEEPCIIFDYEDMDAYNSSVGIPVAVYQEFESNWQNFLL